MLIAIDASRAVTTQRTGTEGYAYYLIQELVSLATARGYHLRLYFNQAPPGELFHQNSHTESVVISSPRLWTHIRLGWALRQAPPDVFFTPAHVIPLTHRGPAVATVHDLGYHFYPQAHTRFQVAYLHWSTRHNARRSRQILADSQATKRDLIRLYNVPEQKITVVYPGIDPALAPVNDVSKLHDVQARHAIEAPYLLYLGTLQPRKNLVRLVNAFVASGVPQSLVFAGKPGWLSGPILEHIATLPQDVAARIRITGYVADEDKAALLSGATALLFPSQYEGFGFPVLEAQKCGTAVMCADNSSLPEVAGDGALLVDAGSVTEIAEGIRRLVEDEALRAQLVSAGYANVQRFTWQAAAQQTMAVLESVATGSS